MDNSRDFIESKYLAPALKPEELQKHTEAIGYKWVFMRPPTSTGAKCVWWASCNKPNKSGYFQTYSGMIMIHTTIIFDGVWQDSLFGPGDISDDGHNEDGERFVR